MFRRLGSVWERLLNVLNVFLGLCIFMYIFNFMYIVLCVL